jgi:hypothetical protein
MVGLSGKKHMGGALRVLECALNGGWLASLGDIKHYIFSSFSRGVLKGCSLICISKRVVFGRFLSSDGLKTLVTRSKRLILALLLGANGAVAF